MFSGDATVQALRDALCVSPDNLPLRQHLAETLLALGRLDEAEHEYRQALAQASANDVLKVGLANVFYQQGKNSQALVIVEVLLKQRQVPPRAYLLHARLLVRAGEVERAVRQYREAIDADPTLADADFAESLGIDADLDKSDVVEGLRIAPGEIGTGCLCLQISFPTIYIGDELGEGTPSIEGYSGVITVDNEEEKSEIAGELTLYKLLLSEYDYRTVLLDCDDISSELSELACTCLNPDDKGVEPLKYVELSLPFLDVLVVDSIKLKEEYRHRGYGLWIMKQAVNLVGRGCCACVILPCPLGNPTDKVGRRKLQSYWSKLGFKRLGRTGFFYKDLGIEWNDVPPPRDNA